MDNLSWCIILAKNSGKSWLAKTHPLLFLDIDDHMTRFYDNMDYDAAKNDLSLRHDPRILFVRDFSHVPPTRIVIAALRLEPFWDLNELDDNHIIDDFLVVHTHCERNNQIRQAITKNSPNPLAAIPRLPPLIYDSSQIERFVNILGFEQNPHMSMLAIRSKYCKGVSTAMCSRTVARDCKSLVRNIIRTPIPFTDESDNIMSLGAMAIYSTINPRDEAMAIRDLAMTATQLAFDGALTAQSARSPKLQQKSRLHACCSDKRFVTVDIDIKSAGKDILAWLLCRIGEPAHAIETRGGYHLLYDLLLLDGNQKQILFADLPKVVFQRPSSMSQSIRTHDVLSDAMCPVPGTMQGGFPVRFVNCHTLDAD